MNLDSNPVVPPKRIRRLPEELINQIAAGEVVERPSSIIKELVENSLDAGATRIDILLHEGGTGEISVIDNGHGIEEEDLPLAVERHATSKVTRLHDLESLGTFGFRGEALASMGSVGRLEIVSRTAQMPKASGLCLEYGRLVEPRFYEAAPVGTRVTVKQLFSQIPARLKFLRSPGTEFSHCARLVRDLALGNPSVAFLLHHQGKMVHSYAPGDHYSRFKDCFRPGWEPVFIEDEASGLALKAFLSPHDWYSDRGELFVFINGRCVRHKTIASAIRNAYLEALGPHHEPSGAVYLEIRKDWVDVNVHPQKWEVRILRQDALYAWILTQLRKTLPTIPETKPLELPAVGVRRPGTIGGLKWLGRTERYLVIEEGEAIHLVDSQVLTEIVMLEEKPKPLSFSPPRMLRVPPPLRPILFEQSGALRELAFQLEVFEGGDVAVKAAPYPVTEASFSRFLSRLKDGEQALAQADLARAHLPRLPDEELVAQAARRWEHALKGLRCPHGTKLILSLTERELAKHFGGCEPT